MNFKYKLMQFMSGRYGIDLLFYVLFGISVLLVIINMFIGSIVMQLIIDVIMIFSFYRVLSRKIEVRRRENQVVLNMVSKVKNRQLTIRRRKADYTHIYKKCPRCHAVLRLPRRKGKHTTVCPKCSKKFKVYVFKA